MYKTADGGCGRLESVWPGGRGRPTPLRPCGCQSICRCTACCRRLRSASAGDGEKKPRRHFMPRTPMVLDGITWFAKKQLWTLWLQAALPHSPSSPHRTPCLHGPPGRTEEPCSCGTLKKLYILYIHTNVETQEKDNYLPLQGRRQRWRLSCCISLGQRQEISAGLGHCCLLRTCLEWEGRPAQRLCRRSALIWNNIDDEVPGLTVVQE